MKQAIFWLLPVFMVSCSPKEPAPFVGNSVSELPYRIKTRSYPQQYKGIPYRATETNTYDSLNRLVRADSVWSDRSVTYTYTTNRLTERLTVSTQDGRLFFKENFGYDSAGRLLLRTWTDNGSTAEYRYTYNSANQITAIQTTQFGKTTAATYQWSDSNVAAVVYTNEIGKKTSEWSYTYDTSPNVRALLPVSPSPDDPFTATRNNVVAGQLDRDYLGIIDLIVNPVRYKVSYDTNGLLTQRLYNYDGRYEDFVYEAKQ